ncbi:MAG: PD-(D/E)XK nuclease family protein [Archangium sp.]
MEQWLLDASRSAAFVDLRGVCTFAQLIERCEPAAFSRRAPADPLLVRFLFGHHARTHAAAFGSLATSPEFAAQAQELVGELRSNGAEPWHLLQVASKVEGAFAARVHALAELWRVVDASLEALELVDRGEWPRLAGKRLEEQGLPPALRGHSVIEVKDLHDVPLARLKFLEQLASACERVGVTFKWSWPAAGESNVDAFIVEAVRGAEAAWAQLDLQLERDVSEMPLAWVGRELFAPVAEKRAAPELSAFVAPTARDEVREIARRVRRSVTAGIPAESIAVVFRDLADDTELLVEALAELGVPARARLGGPLAQSGLGRLALAVLDLADGSFRADAVASILESRLVNALHEEAAEPRRAFREAGVRDDALGGVDGSGAFAARLKSLAMRSRDAARSVELLAEGVERLLSLARAIEEDAKGFELLDAWWDALSKLGLLDPSRVAVPHSEGLMSAELARAQALDQAAVEALATMLTSLKASLKESGFGAERMSRRSFARWVRDAAADVNLVARGARGGAVWLLDARGLAGRRFAQVFVGGLVDGRFPGRPSPLSLLSEDERGELNRAWGRPLFRTSVGEGDVRLPSRLAEDRLLFHFALSAGAVVTLSRSRFDDKGRETLASPFLDAVRRVVDGFEELPVRRAAVAVLDEVQSEAELRVRAALEALSPPVTRQTRPDARGAALAGALESEGWFQAARAHGVAEAERLRFFSDERQAAADFSGRLRGDALALMQARVAYDSAHPLSAHELQQWAQCAFRGLSLTVLGLEAVERAGEDVDARARGDFWHEALAEVVPALATAGLLGKAVPAVRAHVESAVKVAAAKTEKKYAVGHPALWTLAQEWAVRVIFRVVSSRHSQPFGVLATPKFVEVEFGTAKSPDELRSVKVEGRFSDETDVYLRGRMDRVDVTAGTIGVVDYKSSVSKTLSRDFLVREFQMPFYLLAVKSLDAQASVTGAWLGLGKNELKTVGEMKAVGPVNELLAMDALTRQRLDSEGKPNLANAVHDVLRGLRSGDFGPRSKPECGACELKPVCRISQRKLLEDMP